MRFDISKPSIPRSHGKKQAALCCGDGTSRPCGGASSSPALPPSFDISFDRKQGDASILHSFVRVRPAASGSPQSFPSWKAPAPLPVQLPDSIGQAGLRNIELLHCMADGAGAGNSRDIAELLKGHGSFLSACFFYPTAEPPKTQRIFFFEIPNEHCRHIQDTFYPPCNFPYNSTAVLKRLQHSHITKEAFRYGTTAK